MFLSKVKFDMTKTLIFNLNIVEFYNVIFCSIRILLKVVY